MKVKEEFTVRSLAVEDAHALGALLRSQSDDYVRFFKPFSFDQDTISNLVARRKHNVFMGMFWNDELAGFFMLRGWDEGYDVPAYGVLIAEKFGGYGLTTLSLRMAKAACKLSRCPAVMLKVHPDNARAKSVFERAGFAQTGLDAATGNLVYHFNFDGLATKF